MNMKAFMKEELKNRGTIEFPGIDKFKDEKGKPSPLQKTFISVVNADGGRAGVVRSVEEAENLVFGK